VLIEETWVLDLVQRRLREAVHDFACEHLLVKASVPKNWPSWQNFDPFASDG
jgi:hypothetical protein